MLGDSPDGQEVARAIEHLGERLDFGIESLRAEARETRRSLILVVLVAVLVLGAALGVGVTYGDARIAPARAPVDCDCFMPSAVQTVDDDLGESVDPR